MNESAEQVSLIQSLEQHYAQLENDPTRETKAEAPETPTEKIPEVPAIEAPQHWPKDRRDVFAKAPPELQQVWLDREREYDQGINQKGTELRDIKARLDQYDTVINPLKQSLLAQGQNEYQWLEQMAAYTRALQNDPAGVLKAVARQYGVDLGTLGGGSDEFIDPAVKSLKDEIATLKQQISQTAQSQTQTIQQQQERIINEFREAKGPDGQPLRPHFDAVIDDIAVLAQGYRASGKQLPTLEALYLNAVRMRPELMEADAQRAEQARRLQSIEAARKAKGASARPKDTATDAGTSKPKDLKSHLGQLYDQMAS